MRRRRGIRQCLRILCRRAARRIRAAAALARLVLLAVIGIKPKSTFWSNARRMTGRVTLALVGFLCAEAFGLVSFRNDATVAALAVPWSVGFFVLTVASVIWLGGSEAGFRPDPFRLIGDIVVSAAMTVFGFAVAYRRHGLIDTLGAQAPPVREIDHLYFSIVSFSTLGYGDLRIDAEGRLLAASQAVIGNLHLGLLAGAVFYALQSGARRADDAGQPRA